MLLINIRYMKIYLKITALVILALISSASFADFAEDLYAKFPKSSGAIVKKSFGNFYSVVKDNSVVFINEDMTILINGDRNGVTFGIRADRDRVL